MKIKRFERIMKPVCVLAFVLALAAAALTTLDMWSDVYRDKAVYGIVESADGSVVRLTDGQAFDTPIPDIGRYCQPGSEIRVESGRHVSVWCNQGIISTNMLEDLG